MSRRTLQFFGEISYGVCLIHMLVFDLEAHALGRFFPRLYTVSNFGLMILLFSIATGFTVGIAHLSRWYFKEPFLRMKRGFEGHWET